MTKYFLIPAFLFFTGCQTPGGMAVTEVNMPVKYNRIAVVAAFGEARIVSQNGREITSHYHDRKFKFLDVTPKTTERLYTKTTILGARRPYNISVEVHVEQKDSATKVFQDIGIDDRLSELRVRSLKEALNQSRDKIQTIDVESPF